MKRKPRKGIADKTPAPFDLLSKSLSHADISQIVSLAKVPDERRLDASKSIDVHICLFEDRQWNRDLKREKLNDETFAKLTVLTENLRNGLREATEALGPTLLLFNFDWSHDDQEIEMDEFALLDVLDEFHSLCSSYSRIPEKKAAHRPRSSIASSALGFLVKYLYLGLVTEGGGKLTLWNSGGQSKGTWPALLSLLHERMPDKVPAAPSYETLRAMLRKVEAGAGATLRTS